MHFLQNGNILSINSQLTSLLHFKGDQRQYKNWLLNHIQSFFLTNQCRTYRQICLTAKQSHRVSSGDRLLTTSGTKKSAGGLTQSANRTRPRRAQRFGRLEMSPQYSPLDVNCRHRRPDSRNINGRRKTTGHGAAHQQKSGRLPTTIGPGRPTASCLQLDDGDNNPILTSALWTAALRMVRVQHMRTNARTH